MDRVYRDSFADAMLVAHEMSVESGGLQVAVVRDVSKMKWFAVMLEEVVAGGMWDDAIEATVCSPSGHREWHPRRIR